MGSWPDFRGVILGLIADQFLGVADVPITASIVREAEENRKGELRAERLYQKLRQIARAAPFAAQILIRAQPLKVTNIRLHRLVVRFPRQRLEIEQPEREMFPQQRNDVGSDSPPGAGDENSLAHRFSITIGPSIPRPSEYLSR